MGTPRELGELGTGNGLHGNVVVFDFLALVWRIIFIRVKGH
jgi:hypothetical protein